MKGALLALVSVGVPLALMMLIGFADRGRESPGVAGASSRSVAATTPAADPRSPASRQPARDAPVDTNRGQAGILARIEQWLEPWPDRLRGDPDSPRVEAAQDLRDGRYERAAAAFDRLLTRTPDDPDLLRGAAAALCRLHDYDGALPLLERAVELEPRDAPTRFQLAIALTRLNRRAEAIAALEGLLRVSPDHARAQFALAVLQQSLDQKAEALATWRQVTEPLRSPAVSGQAKATALDASAACEAFFHHGEMAMALQHNLEAKGCFEELVHRAPRDAPAWCNLGIVCSAIGRQEEAVAALHEALRLKPELVPALNQLAYVHASRYRVSREAGDRQTVIDLCRRSLAVRSYQPNILALKNAAIEADWTGAPPPGASPAQPAQEDSP